VWHAKRSLTYIERGTIRDGPCLVERWCAHLVGKVDRVGVVRVVIIVIVPVI